MVISFCSCKHDYNPPPDFNFSLKFGYFGDKISTFDSTYRTDGELASNRWGDTAVKVVFTKEEMKLIYEALIKYDYLSLPDTLIAKECIMPCGRSQLIVVANSKKKIIYTTECCPTTHYMQVFDSIQSPIFHILFPKKEIKNLLLHKPIAL